MNKSYASLLALVQKPSRYIGSEWNVPKQAWDDKTLLKVALGFPELYEVGMSHLGLKILSNILIQSKESLVDRFFLPAPDMEELLRRKKLPPISLSSGIPLNDFDVLGFSLQTEVSYTNILTILDLAFIPFFSEKRGNDVPFIIAGGPCTFNPEPLASFFDLFLIGDGEVALPELIHIISLMKKDGADRLDILIAAALLQGIYVPSLVDVQYNEHEKIKAFNFSYTSENNRIKKAIIADIDEATLPTNDIVPFLNTVHDRITVESARGCPNSCRFCQAQAIYRPYRERSSDKIVENALELLNSSGHEELSLVSLSTTDYSALTQVISKLYSVCAPQRISISLPSMRPKEIPTYFSTFTQGIRKTGITIAPEAGTERLRFAINKRITNDEIFAAIQEISKGNTQTIKLYFMIGLPTETDEDIFGIINLVRKIRGLLNKKGQKNPTIKVSISPFIPKPHTPFQWAQQQNIEVLATKSELIKRNLQSRNIIIHYHNPQLAILEGIFARGGRQLNDLILQAYKNGCKMDGWSEFFNFDLWKDTFEKNGLDIKELAYKNWEFKEKLPWDFIDIGISKNTLWKDYQTAMQGKPTPTCLEKNCVSCKQCEYNIIIKNTDNLEKENKYRTFTPNVPTHYFRYRIHFQKTGMMKFLSHRETAKTLYQALRRSDMPLAFSQGFNPHPKMSFGDALPIGIISLEEYLDVDLIDYINPSDLTKNWNSTLPSGFQIISSMLIPRSLPPLDLSIKETIYNISAYRHLLEDKQLIEDEQWITLFPSSIELLNKQIDEKLTEDDLIYTEIRKRQLKKTDIKPFIKNFSVIESNDNEIKWLLILKNIENRRIRPNAVFKIFYPLGNDGLKLLEITKLQNKVSE